jgi:hypothetical protein
VNYIFNQGTQSAISLASSTSFIKHMDPIHPSFVGLKSLSWYPTNAKYPEVFKVIKI